ncbi:hypothetical protein GPECTOR_145g738 [Gonium pectorale]|uniref:BTB domain-containing protein n=1 Tax=Gonium pectorale TaxID=33097 RepID=A0A150FXZ3_GONPE|nr:hypothetical protein GPECTOR_145g738 [Gonium pectorale]|eukprot:KXZ42447.1 hypothetical protein GPECTOR_145g738 [Gonium pectorale]
MRVQVVAATGVRAVVARPHPAAAGWGPWPRQEVLVFCAFGVCPLILPDSQGAPPGGRVGGPAPALDEPIKLGGDAADRIGEVTAALYDPHSYFVILAVPGGMLSLDSNDDVNYIVGDPDPRVAPIVGPPRDGLEPEAAITAPWRVAVCRAANLIHFLEVLQGPSATTVTLLRRAQILHGLVAVGTLAYGELGGGLSYNPHTDALLYNDTPYSISLVPPHGSHARFLNILCMAVDERGDVLVLDERSLRLMRRTDGQVVTLERDFPRGDVPAVSSLAAPPGGWLALWNASGGQDLVLVQLPRTDAQPQPQPQPQARPQQLMPAAAAATAATAAAVEDAAAEEEAAGTGQRELLCGSAVAKLVADFAALLQAPIYGGGGGDAGGDGAGSAAVASDVIIIADGGEGSEGDGGGEGSGGENGGDARRSFPAHRAILAARCPYFRRLFAGGFADSAAPRVELPGAELEALAAVLRHLYTGDPGELAEGLLRPVAELADRLLLPELRDHVAARLVRSVTPGTVVDAMLWADRAGAGMEGLLRRLVAYFAAHRAEVAAQAAGGLDELVSKGSPGLIRRLLA